MPGPALDAILALAREWETALGERISAMREVAALHDDKIVVPLPELDRAEKPYFANLIAQAVDQGGMRVGSVLPTPRVPSVDPGKKAADANAEVTRLATLAVWGRNGMGRKLRRRARQLIAYAAAPVVVLPDRDKVARWEVRHALTALPDPACDPDDLVPPAVIFTFARSKRWLAERYPDLRVRGWEKAGPGDPFAVLEYIDADVRVIAARAARRHAWEMGFAEREMPEAAEAARIPNRIGVPLAVCPGRISLNAPRGQFDGTAGIVQMLYKMSNLAAISVDKGIFADTVLLGRPGETPRILSHNGQWQDGRTGNVNIVTGVQSLDTLKVDPGYMTNPTIDRLERALRAQGLIPAQWGGEGPAGLRTGRANEVVEGSAVDHAIAEAQEILAASLAEEHRIFVKLARAYNGMAPRQMFVRWPTASGGVAFTPGRHFQTEDVEISYAIPGADVNSTTVNLTQLVAAEAISKRTMRRRHPWVRDPDEEERQIDAEAIRRAHRASLEQAGISGAMPPVYFARIDELVTGGMSLFEAVRKADEEASERQASSGPPGAPAGPVPPGSPEAQPGLAAGPLGAAQPAEAPPAIGPPTPSQGNLTQMLRALRTTGQIAGAG
jgi:hypothetical protein